MNDSEISEIVEGIAGFMVLGAVVLVSFGLAALSLALF